MLSIANNNKMGSIMKEKLLAHVANISFTLINQLTSKGVILTQYNSHIEEDIVSTHHTIELLKLLNINVFSHYIENTLGYMTNPENQVTTSLFTIDTLSQLVIDNKEVEILIDDILKTQLESGAFTKYTAFLHGGDFFSTLWCLKLLINMENKKYDSAVKKGFDFLNNNIEDEGISSNQKGLFYLLANKFGNTNYDKEKLKNDLIGYISDTKINSDNLLWHLYIYEDLLVDLDDKTEEIVWSKFSSAFEFNKEVVSIPIIFEELQNSSAESIFYQCLARFCIVALKFLSKAETLQLSFEINKYIQSNGQQAIYRAHTTEKQLKEFLSIYGGIHEQFAKYNKILENIWKDQASFEKSIFIMMPFKKEIAYTETTKIIKNTCKKRGYKAIRIDDKDRQFHQTLWDNLVINLLSCKYAIAIYASDQIVDILDGNNPKMFPNPNVALEFGFFTSRGQKILLLRDKKSPIPSDLKGFIWNGVNINQPGKDIQNIVNNFIDQISLDEQEG